MATYNRTTASQGEGAGTAAEAQGASNPAGDVTPSGAAGQADSTQAAGDGEGAAASGSAAPSETDESPKPKQPKPKPSSKPSSKTPGKLSSKSASTQPPRKKRIWLRVLIVCVVLVVLVIGVIAGSFAWDRWYRYDDAADIQGRWYPAGATSSIEIGPDAIAFDSETSYAYTLDTHEKTITYQLGPLEGKGHYWFADDRNVLVIEDGEDFTANDTALEDFKRMYDGMNASIDGVEQPLPEGEGISVFARTPDPEAVAAKEEAEREAKEAEEAAARAEQEAIEKAEREAEEAAERAAAEAAGEEYEPTDFASESMGILE